MASRSTLDTDHLDTLLKACDPQLGWDLTGPELERALEDVGHAIAIHGPTRARKRRLWPTMGPRTVGLVASATMFAGAGAAVASQLLSAHTHTYPKNQADMRSGGPGEELNLAAPDGRMVVSQVSADIQYPAGYESWRRWLASDVIHEAAPQPCPRGVTGTCPTLISTGALRARFADSAFCAWTVAWRQNTVTGNRAMAQRAARMIASAPRWEAITAAQAASGPASASLSGSLVQFVAAVRSGQRARVDKLLADETSGSPCWGYDPAFVRSANSASAPGSAYIRFLNRAPS